MSATKWFSWLVIKCSPCEWPNPKQSEKHRETSAIFEWHLLRKGNGTRSWKNLKHSTTIFRKTSVFWSSNGWNLLFITSHPSIRQNKLTRITDTKKAVMTIARIAGAGAIFVTSGQKSTKVAPAPAVAFLTGTSTGTDGFEKWWKWHRNRQ